MLTQLRRYPRAGRFRIQQPADYPTLDVNVDRTKASQGGYTELNVADSVLNTLSGKLPDTTDVHSQLLQRRQLQPGCTVSAIHHAVHAGSEGNTDHCIRHDTPRDP